MGENLVVLVNGAVSTPRNDDVGFDVHAAVAVTLRPGMFAEVKTGCRVQTPPGVWYQIVPRSSMARRGVIVAPNVIDPGYNGELSVFMLAAGDAVEIHRGDRIAQLVFFEAVKPTLRVVDEFPSTPRGDRGFGSTGR